MAEHEITRIAEQAIEEHGLCAAAVEHRVGTVPLSEPAVIVAVSALRQLPDSCAGRKKEGTWTMARDCATDPTRAGSRSA